MPLSQRGRSRRGGWRSVGQVVVGGGWERRGSRWWRREACLRHGSRAWRSRVTERAGGGASGGVGGADVLLRQRESRRVAPSRAESRGSASGRRRRRRALCARAGVARRRGVRGCVREWCWGLGLWGDWARRAEHVRCGVPRGLRLWAVIPPSPFRHRSSRQLGGSPHLVPVAVFPPRFPSPPFLDRSLSLSPPSPRALASRPGPTFTSGPVSFRRCLP